VLEEVAALLFDLPAQQVGGLVHGTQHRVGGKCRLGLPHEV